MESQDCNVFAVWNEYKTSLLKFISIKVNNENDAQDLLQEVLLKSYQYCAKGKQILHWKAWLFKIAHNAIIDYFKKKNKFVPLEFDLNEELSEVSLVGDASEYIKPLLKLLPEKYATPLSLADIEGINHKEIAERLNLSLPNTKSRILRARQKLKSRFLECCNIEFNEVGELIRFDVKPHCTELNKIENKIK